ncbi:MAG: hypothetical protein K2M45_09050 [Muribaculaceae bacterium]|nr:hypothetical protein [Muribaculaceae bacterium]
MEREFKESDLSYMPVSFRVIGYGDSFQDVIQEINEIGYDGLQAKILSEGASFAPTDEDRMTIFLCSSECRGLESLLNTFHQAGVLTIVISTDSLNIPTQSYDSLMVAGRNEMISVVKSLLNPVFYQGRINYDFNDLVYTLRDSYHFITLTAAGSGTDRMKNAVTSLSDMFPIDEGVENMSLIIRANDKVIAPPLCMEEMSLITDYIGRLPESVNVIWAMYNDETLDCHTVGLSVIASGKDMDITR